MSENFSEKKARVVVVDPSGPVRQMMTDTIRQLGFENVQGQSSIQDTLQYLEVEDADWLIVPLMADQTANAMHLLKICTEVPQLKGVRVSLLLEEDEKYVLPNAFELGLLSWHAKPFTKETLPEEFNKFLEKFSSMGWDESLVAADYLRGELTSAGLHEARMELEKSMLQQYPGDSNILMEYARALHNNDQADEARAVLLQVCHISEQSKEKAEAIGKEMFGEEGIGDVEGSGVNVLGLKSVVVVDSDDAARKEIEELVQEVGVEEFHDFADGEAAWGFLKDAEEPGLVVMEWRIPKLSGPFFVQRVREKFHAAPVMVQSSLLKAADMPLAKEMGISAIINKPVKKDDFLASLIHTIQQERSPTEHYEMERKMRALLKQRKQDEANQLKAEYFSMDNVPLPRKRLIEAEFALAAHDYKLARDAAVESLKIAGDSILTLNVLGKAFMFLNDHASALKCFRKAQELSPKNVGRLCSIAEAEAELGNDEAAKDAMEDADLLDPDAQVVQDAKVKVAIGKGDVEGAKKLMSQMESLSSLLAYMNNKAVAHAKCDLFDEAMELYKRTIRAIPDERADLKAIVQYNYGLAQVRASNFEEAAEILRETVAGGKSRVRAKAKSLLERLERAIERGEELELKGAPDAKSAPAGAPAGGPAAGTDGESGEGGDGEESHLTSEDDLAQMIAAVEARKGDMCCYLLYTHSEGLEPRVESLLAKQPRFQQRESIERAESFGAEMSKKTA